MRVAIVHYHLQTGGVTRVIEHAATTLLDRGVQVAVLASGTIPQGFPCPVEAVPELGYDEDRQTIQPDRLQQALERAARESLGGEPDLWHIHNHNLGKNLALPVVVANLARSNRRLLLQIHDFPEDFRAYNYRRLRRYLPGDDFGRYLYPCAPQVHYAVLNGRDRLFLKEAGLPENQLHLLPNPVAMPAFDDQEIPKWPFRLWLYPTRAIRRKNLGEWLLWAALAGPDDHFATSLAPANPREQARYQTWLALAERLKLPVSFDLASRYKTSFGALLRLAHCLGTTSIAEGFGMAFLEPWLLEQAVCGRNLPEITSDFEQAGLNLSSLYQRLEIPLSWLKVPELKRCLQAALTELYSSYGLSAPGPAEVRRAWEAWVVADRVDFGRLDETHQSHIIEHLWRVAGARTELPRPQLPVADPEIVAGNRAVVLASFNLPAYGKRLLSVYQSLLAAPFGSCASLDHRALLHCFLQPERLHLLRL